MLHGLVYYFLQEPVIKKLKASGPKITKANRSANLASMIKEKLAKVCYLDSQIVDSNVMFYYPMLSCATVHVDCSTSILN
jgi:hypothetical protein